MPSKLESTTRKLEVRRRALLRRYDDEDLHQLRVSLRRMRSALKHRQGKRAKLLRDQLGKLADVTNAARDWDTLVARAQDELGPRQFKRLAPRLLAKQAATHVPVQTMLESPEWRQAIDDWTRYLARHPAGQDDRHGKRKLLKRLEEREDAVDRAWRRTQAVDSERNWHRLRIAVKELRYCLDETPKTARKPATAGTLRRCKRLQAYLGDWHDTSVHLQLIQKLGLEFDPVKEQKALKLVQRWCGRIERQGNRLLDSARAQLPS